METRHHLLRVCCLAALGLSILSGCDDATQTNKPTTKPSEVAATDSSDQAVVAAYPIRPPAIFTIDGRQVAFPAARLAIVDHRGGLTLRLFSDDPPTAIDPSYIGNSFSFDMRLPIDRADDIAISTWDHKPADADDGVSGIYEHGMHNGLRPYSVHVAFQKSDGQLIAYVDGFFLRNDPQNPMAAPQQIHASGSLKINAVE